MSLFCFFLHLLSWQVMEIDSMLVNLRMEAVHVKELFSINWLCASGLVKNIGRVVEEYRHTRRLLVHIKAGKLHIFLASDKEYMIFYPSICLNEEKTLAFGYIVDAYENVFYSPSAFVSWDLLQWGRAPCPKRSLSTTNCITSG